MLVRVLAVEEILKHLRLYEDMYSQGVEVRDTGSTAVIASDPLPRPLPGHRHREEGEEPTELLLLAV